MSVAGFVVGTALLVAEVLVLRSWSRPETQLPDDQKVVIRFLYRASLVVVPLVVVYLFWLVAT